VWAVSKRTGEAQGFSPLEYAAPVLALLLAALAAWYWTVQLRLRFRGRPAPPQPEMRRELPSNGPRQDLPDRIQ
jgi:hypothetical protein